MSNNRKSEAATLDAMIDAYRGMACVAYPFEAFKGSYTNPLQAMRLLAIDPETQGSIDEADLAKLTGLPVRSFTDDVLTGVSDDQLLKALGQCALVFLDCVRGQIRKDILEEAETLPMNGVEGVLSTWNEVRGAGVSLQH